MYYLDREEVVEKERREVQQREGQTNRKRRKTDRDLYGIDMCSQHFLDSTSESHDLRWLLISGVYLATWFRIAVGAVIVMSLQVSQSSLCHCGT